jgi:eukaryotic-like serine/threonine-protein kinase
MRLVLCFHENGSRIRPLMGDDSQSSHSHPPDGVDSASTMLVSSLASPGQLVSDRFRIEKLIARGGMGEVYRATDLELNRVVALKTVRSSSLMAQDLRTRLRQEAQLISKLNHSGICTLYDVRQHAGVDYLVLEFIDGETLAKRLSRGPLSLEQSLDVALQVLAALQYAHRQGVIHRDIKPGNVMLTKGGAKLLDFGIAKLAQYTQTAHEPEPSHGPLTPTGVAVGTPAFMPPEQRDGVADVRSDIYAFGLMFAGLLGARTDGSLENQFDIAKVDAPFRQVIAKCLKDDPADRWQDSGDLMIALELVSRRPLQEKSNRKSMRRRNAFLVTAILIAITALSLLMILRRPSSPASAHIEFQMLPPAGSQFPTIEQSGPAVVSPDGAAVAFVARDQNGQQRLWLRRLDSVSALPLNGTEGASHPFWSPDSHAIGFFAQNKLMTIEIARGVTKFICEAREGRGATWGKDVIVFSPGFTDRLLRVSANGGVPAAITVLDVGRQENSHRWPYFLPDSKHLLFVVRAISRENSGLYVASLDGGSPKRIGEIESSAIYAPHDPVDSGDLVYVRGSQIIAQPFRTDTLELSGEPTTIADLGWTDTSTTRVPVSVSSTGVLVYGGGQSASSQFVWYDLAGRELSRLNYSGVTRFLRLSPDMKTVAAEKLDFRFGSGSLWFLGTQQSISTRFTFEPISAYTPVWSPDGQYVAYAVHTGKDMQLTVAAIDGSSTRVLLSTLQSAPIEPTDWTKDGLILYEMRNANTGWDLHAVSVRQPDIKTVLLNSPADERQARVSQDGKWIAYTSNEDGTEQVYLRSFPISGPRIQVSASGGSQPIWARNSTDIFFVDRERMLLRSHVDVRLKRASVPTSLFRFPPATDPGLLDGWEYDVAANDEKFLTGWPGSLQESRPITVASGWK